MRRNCHRILHEWICERNSLRSSALHNRKGGFLTRLRSKIKKEQSGLEIQIPDILRVFFDEFTPGFDRIAH